MTTIFEANHDAGGVPTDYWTTVIDSGSKLTITVGSALDGSVEGLNAELGTATSKIVQKSVTPPASNEFRARYFFDPNSATVTGASNVTMSHFRVRSGGSVSNVLLQVRYTDPGVYKLWGEKRDDSDVVGVALFGGTGLLDLTDGPHCVEIREVKETTSSSNDGQRMIYLDGVLVSSAAAVDNFARFGAIDVIEMTFISSADGVGNFYADEVIMDDDAGADLGCGAAAATPFRFLGLAADTEQLYIAGLKDGATLQLYTYSDLDTLTEGGTIHAFGAATDSDIDSLAKGIFPVTRPGADKVIYLFGRDGSDTQVQKNNLNGAGGWQDIGAGSPTWATTKMCIALMPDVLDPDDLIAAFGDDDVYRSQDDGAAWVKMGDAPTTLRGGARHPITDNELLLAGTASGDLHYSHNFGVSFDAADIASLNQTIEHRVEASGDDGFVSPSIFFDTSTMGFGHNSGAGDLDAWVRIPQVGVPNGATITNAYIEFKARASSGTVNLVIYGEDADDPAAPTSVADYNGRTRTATNVAWAPSAWTAGQTYQTPDISAIVQEIADRPGWSFNNAMQLFIENTTSVDRERQGESYDTDADNAPLLHVEYTADGGLVNSIEYSL